MHSVLSAERRTSRACAFQEVENSGLGVEVTRPAGILRASAWGLLRSVCSLWAGATCGGGGGPPETPMAISDRRPVYPGYRLFAGLDVTVEVKAKRSFAGVAQRA